MTNVVLEAHIEAMPAIRAERLLDAAQAAAYPLHLRHAPRQAQAWWRQLVADTQDAVASTVGRSVRRARLTFNGAAIGLGTLKTKLAEALRGGLAA